MIYLDYNATAPMRPDVKSAMAELLGEALNPSSVHNAGRRARKIVEEARAAILQSVNAENLIFCGSGTEANNLALAQGNSALVSEIEHDSVYKYPGVKTFKVLPSGLADLEDLRSRIKNQKPEIVSVMLANNETGVIQPIKEIAKIAHDNDAVLHIDAVQAYGKIPVDFKDLGADLMTISSHKIGGPVGAAALVCKDLDIQPTSFGGGQEKNKRPGTENVISIAGFGTLAKNVSRETFSDLRDYLESQLHGSIIFGQAENRLPNTTCLAMPGVESATQLIHFDMAKFCVSSGSACSSGRVEVSRVLKAMDAPHANCALRVSTGWETTKEEIDKFIKSWTELYNRTKERAA